ncbi:Arginine exporter protein ArgO [hydrothermal vent metagenome]|uniref:Arginine exporter protein ArgO n=1 Tax=hydrothermal vent metagenome TaxID=652676 RepID=A0A3B0RG96_9ZZZZ
MSVALLEAGVAGFLLGGSLIIAIGAQNAFVLKLGIIRKHVFPVTMICALSDAVLIIAGIAGFGILVKSAPGLIVIVTYLGAAFLFVYGAMAFARSAKVQTLQTANVSATSLSKAVITILSLTFLNPHVYLDTVVLLGSLSTAYVGGAKLAFGAGATMASFVWFFVLGYGARLLGPIFEKPFSWRVLEFSIGVVMWAIAAKLLYSHFQASGFLSPAGS